jgi:nucleoid-associated protein YgaU
MRKFYIGAVLVIVFLVAWATDWNIRQGSAQLRDGTVTMIESRTDDILEIEVGYPPGKVPKPRKQRPPPPPQERVPTGSMTVVEPDAPEPAWTGPTSDGYRLYEVKKGDTLSEIAMDQLGTATRANEIMALNGIKEAKSIRPGMKLKIPRN